MLVQIAEDLAKRRCCSVRRRDAGRQHERQGRFQARPLEVEIRNGIARRSPVPRGYFRLSGDTIQIEAPKMKHLGAISIRSSSLMTGVYEGASWDLYTAVALCDDCTIFTALNRCDLHAVKCNCSLAACHEVAA